MNVSALDRPGAELAALREQVATSQRRPASLLPFGMPDMDGRIVGGGIDGAGLHEIAAASPKLSDDAAATLFVAGIAGRFARLAGKSVLWTLTRFDLYAPGLEQAGLDPATLLYAQGRKDSDILAMSEDALRNGSLACIVAEVKAADRTATRRLQLAASDSSTPVLLYRRHRAASRCPLETPSPAMTRWRIGVAPSEKLAVPGVGRGRWTVELVRQRGGNPFSLELEACDDTGRLALPAAARDRASAPDGAANQAA